MAANSAREAIKVSLALIVAFYLPLRFEWMSATWPAISVAFISMPTAGQSIAKGLLRIGGTLLAFVASLFVLALFPQERWAFLLAFSLYLAFATYKMTGRDGQYFWFCAAFVALMIATAGFGNGDAFIFAAYRTMETIAGVVIWALVCVLLWPRWSEPVPAAPATTQTAIRGPWGLPVLDPDRVRATVMVLVAMWLASLICIYLDPPGHTSWFNFVPSLALAFAQVPHVRVHLLRPLLYACLASLILYIFLMPQMSSFAQLGILLFALTFIAAYYFSGFARVAIYLSMFLMLGINNHQTYDFAVVANTLLFTLLGTVLAGALTYINRSPRPEKAFLSLSRRFRRSYEFLVSSVQAPIGSASWWERMRLAFHRQELRTLPAKLEAWAKQIDYTRLPRGASAEVKETLSALEVLSAGMEKLLGEHFADGTGSRVDDLENRLLGLSRATTTYVEAAGRIHWPAWQEEHF